MHKHMLCCWWVKRGQQESQPRREIWTFRFYWLFSKIFCFLKCLKIRISIDMVREEREGERALMSRNSVLGRARFSTLCTSRPTVTIDHRRCQKLRGALPGNLLGIRFVFITLHKSFTFWNVFYFRTRKVEQKERKVGPRWYVWFLFDFFAPSFVLSVFILFIY